MGAQYRHCVARYPVTLLPTCLPVTRDLLPCRLFIVPVLITAIVVAIVTALLLMPLFVVCDGGDRDDSARDALVTFCPITGDI